MPIKSANKRDNEINPMLCLTMKTNRFGKLVNPPLLWGGGVVCLLLLSLIILPIGLITTAGAAEQAKQKQDEVSPKSAAPIAAPLPQQSQDATKTLTEQHVEAPAESAEESTRVSEALGKLLNSMNMEHFEYKVEERPDPFMPFISEKIVQSADSELESGEKLTGMRQFEPGQISLVAIVFTDANPMAMVEDSSHKGYAIRRGTKIGRSGIVSDILPNSIIIKQLSYSMNQENKYTTVEMILRKEGEK